MLLLLLPPLVLLVLVLCFVLPRAGVPEEDDPGPGVVFEGGELQVPPALLHRLRQDLDEPRPPHALQGDCFASARSPFAPASAAYRRRRCKSHPRRAPFQGRLFDNQEGPNTERYVFGKLSAICFHRRPFLAPASAAFSMDVAGVLSLSYLRTR